MHTAKLTSLLLIATPNPVSGVVLAAETSVQSNNGQANPSANAGQVTLDARENMAPGNVDNSNINSGGTMLHPNDSSINHEEVTKDEIHKDAICKDGHCSDTNKEVETENSINNGVETKTDGTMQ